MMIFISKKAFENEVKKRMAEIHFRNRTDEKIFKLENSIKELQFRLDYLEGCNKIPVEKVNAESGITLFTCGKSEDGD